MSDLSLKPCPWCGDENPAVSVSEICCPIEWSAEVRCTNCDASGGSGGVHADKAEAEIEAIDVWNCRPAMQDAAEEMYTMLEKAKSALLKSYDATEYPANGESECDVVASEIDKLLAKARYDDSNPSTLQSEKQGN